MSLHPYAVQGIVVHVRYSASYTKLIDLDISGSYHYGILVDNVYDTLIGARNVLIQNCKCVRFPACLCMCM